MKINHISNQSFKAVYVSSRAEDVFNNVLTEYEKLHGKDASVQLEEKIKKCNNSNRYDIYLFNNNNCEIKLFDSNEKVIKSFGFFNPKTQVKEISKTFVDTVDFVVTEEHL